MKKALKIFGWILAVVGVINAGYWTFIFFMMESDFVYLGEVGLGIRYNLALVFLIMAASLRVFSAIAITPQAVDEIGYAKAQRMTFLSFILFLLAELQNIVYIFIFASAFVRGVEGSGIYSAFMLSDIVLIIISIVQMTLLRKWKRKYVKGGWTASKKLIGLGAIIGVGVCIVINLIVGIPLIKSNIQMKNIGVFHEFELQTLSGDVVTQEDMKGKVTILNVWETTCNPCKKELPALETISQECADTNVQIWGMCFDLIDENGAEVASKEEAKSIIDTSGVTYTNLVPDANIIKVLEEGIEAFPTTFVLDEDGNVLEIVVGANDESTWRTLIQKYENVK